MVGTNGSSTRTLSLGAFLGREIVLRGAGDVELCRFSDDAPPDVLHRALTVVQGWNASLADGTPFDAEYAADVAAEITSQPATRCREWGPRACYAIAAFLLENAMETGTLVFRPPTTTPASPSASPAPTEAA